MDWITSTRQARVLHVFEGVVNLVSGDDQLLSLQLPSVGMTPFALEIAAGADLPGRGLQGLVRQADAVTISSSAIAVGGLRIEVDSPKLWNPRPPWSQLRAKINASWALEMLGGLLLEEAPAGGLAKLFGEGRSNDRQEEALLRRAAPAARSLITGLASEEPQSVEAAAANLAGLGTGLTPSGDDLMMGALHGLWLLRPAAQAAAMGQAIVEAAAKRTTRLSAAWLRAAAAGEAGEIWHALFDQLSLANPAELEPLVRRLLRTGHSSGADALTGMLLYWRAATEAV